MAKRRLNPAAVARALRPYGVEIQAWSVNCWGQDGSSGPKHPIIHVALAEVAGCAVEDIAPSTEHLERKIIRRHGGRGGL